MLAWHDALNAADIETLGVALSGDIDIGDAHRAVQGHDALRGWASSSPQPRNGRSSRVHPQVGRRTRSPAAKIRASPDRRRGVPWSKTTSHPFSGTKTASAEPPAGGRFGRLRSANGS